MEGSAFLDGLPGAPCIVDANCSSNFQRCLNVTGVTTLSNEAVSVNATLLGGACSCYDCWHGTVPVDEHGKCSGFVGVTLFALLTLAVALATNVFVIHYSCKLLRGLDPKKRRSAMGTCCMFTIISPSAHLLYMVAELMYLFSAVEYETWAILAGLSNTVSPPFQLAAAINLPLMWIELVQAQSSAKRTGTNLGKTRLLLLGWMWTFLAVYILGVCVCVCIDLLCSRHHPADGQTQNRATRVAALFDPRLGMRAGYVTALATGDSMYITFASLTGALSAVIVAATFWKAGKSLAQILASCSKTKGDVFETQAAEMSRLGLKVSIVCAIYVVSQLLNTAAISSGNGAMFVFSQYLLEWQTRAFMLFIVVRFVSSKTKKKKKKKNAVAATGTAGSSAASSATSSTVGSSRVGSSGASSLASSGWDTASATSSASSSGYSAGR